MNDIAQTPYELMGGEAAVRNLVRRFYDIMDSAPEARELRAMHAGNLAPMQERLGDFLCGWLGGPGLYHQRPDAKCMSAAHAPFAINGAIRDAWMLCMRRALADMEVPDSARAMVEPAFQRMCEALRNRD